MHHTINNNNPQKFKVMEIRLIFNELNMIDYEKNYTLEKVREIQEKNGDLDLQLSSIIEAMEAITNHLNQVIGYISDFETDLTRKEELCIDLSGKLDESSEKISELEDLISTLKS